MQQPKAPADVSIRSLRKTYGDVVAVEEDDELGTPIGRVETLVPGSSDASVRSAEHYDTRVLRRSSCGDVGGRVDRAIIHDDELPTGHRLARRAEDQIDGQHGCRDTSQRDRPLDVPAPMVDAGIDAM